MKVSYYATGPRYSCIPVTESITGIVYVSTIGENNTGVHNLLNNYGAINFIFSHFLLCIAPYLVIALPTLWEKKLSLLPSFLYCLSYSNCSPNYCFNNNCRSFTLLKAITKSIRYVFAMASKNEKESEIFKTRNQEKKQSIENRLKVITLQEAWEKSQILLSNIAKRTPP